MLPINSLSGGAVTSYSVSPALPTGLALSTSTGVITGTATAITAQASYTITATNTGGSTTAMLAVSVIDAVPTNFKYASTAIVATKGAAITQDNPSNSGGTVTSYAVSPTLPTGLTLNATTGALTGIPTGNFAKNHLHDYCLERRRLDDDDVEHSGQRPSSRGPQLSGQSPRHHARHGDNRRHTFVLRRISNRLLDLAGFAGRAESKFHDRRDLGSPHG